MRPGHETSHNPRIQEVITSYLKGARGMSRTDSESNESICLPREKE